jgi:hypothetical protein
VPQPRIIQPDTAEFNKGWGPVDGAHGSAVHRETSRGSAAMAAAGEHLPAVPWGPQPLPLQNAAGSGSPGVLQLRLLQGTICQRYPGGRSRRRSKKHHPAVPPEARSRGCCRHRSICRRYPDQPAVPGDAQPWLPHTQSVTQRRPGDQQGPRKPLQQALPGTW